jgi:hypothetical protein
MLGQERRAAGIFGAAEALRERTGCPIGTTPFRKLRELAPRLPHRAVGCTACAATLLPALPSRPGYANYTDPADMVLTRLRS